MDEKRKKSVELIHSILLDHDSSQKIEEAIYDSFPDIKKYSQKIRSILFNLKSKSKFREDILQKIIPIEKIPFLSPAEMDSNLWDPIFNKAAKKAKANTILNRLVA